MVQITRQVWNYNIAEEMELIRSSLEEFRYIAIDTEFPGCLIENPREGSEEDYYQSLKYNVERTKVIQFGFTLFDISGRVGPTWEVNFCDFDETRDLKNLQSIEFLKGNGLDLRKTRALGVKAKYFFQAFGQLLTPDKVWASFSGTYDIAYVVKGVCGGGRWLPECVSSFGEVVGKLCGEYHDVKEMVACCRGLDKRLGLQRIADQLGISRSGDAHHAGSDSELTASVFRRVGHYLDMQRRQDETMREIYFRPELEEPEETEPMISTPFFDNHLASLTPRLFHLKISSL